MRTALLHNRKLVVIVVALAALLVALIFIKQTKIVGNTFSSTGRTTTSELNVVGSIMGGSIQEIIDRVAVKVETIDKAKEMLPYNFPVPTDYTDHELTGIYVESKRTLYLRYGDSIYMIYHALPAGITPDIDGVISERPDLFEVEVRGHRGIAGAPGKAEGSDIDRVGGELVWYEGGLDIAIYSYDGTSVDQLLKLANSMKRF